MISTDKDRVIDRERLRGSALGSGSFGVSERSGATWSARLRMRKRTRIRGRDRPPGSERDKVKVRDRVRFRAGGDRLRVRVRVRVGVELGLVGRLRVRNRFLLQGGSRARFGDMIGCTDRDRVRHKFRVSISCTLVVSDGLRGTSRVTGTERTRPRVQTMPGFRAVGW